MLNTGHLVHVCRQDSEKKNEIPFKIIRHDALHDLNAPSVSAGCYPIKHIMIVSSYAIVIIISLENILMFFLLFASLHPSVFYVLMFI